MIDWLIDWLVGETISRNVVCVIFRQTFYEKRFMGKGQRTIHTSHPFSFRVVLFFCHFSSIFAFLVFVWPIIVWFADYEADCIRVSIEHVLESSYRSLRVPRVAGRCTWTRVTAFRLIVSCVISSCPWPTSCSPTAGLSSPQQPPRCRSHHPASSWQRWWPRWRHWWRWSTEPWW